MKPTKDQQRAIDLEGCNIIVSAGAGSGKTAVLSQRVLRKVKSGIHVNELLVLTFTNAAAAEMKNRIRSLLKDENLKEEVDYLDSAYITTFDAFSLALVKKYYMVLNIPKEIKVTDEAIIDLKKKEILDQIMDENYLSPKQSFLKLIHDYCLKDDKELKEYILSAYKKIELKVDKTNFLEHYFEIFTPEKDQKDFEKYLEIIKEKQVLIRDLLEEAKSYFEEDFVSKMKEDLNTFLEANSYNELREGIDKIIGVRLPKNSEEEGKRIKSEVYDIIKELKENYLVAEKEEDLLEEVNSTKETTKQIIDIMKELDKRLEEYKRKEEVYNFNDIARFAIQLVEKNSDIREELKNQFKEILIDEYQDTSDTQEKFISFISDHNCYMVGDIKQSIYRFRNANPYIFKNKYDSYRDTDQGEKIDLLQNFRSRKEVLEDINLLFNKIMDDTIGGADYEASHQMVFGNESYQKEGKTEQNNHMEFLTYNKEELGNVTASEEEAFIIAKDIKDKIEKHTLVFDWKKGLREVTYQDFVILLDKSKDFDLYKKVFEYFHIPLSVLKEESLRKEDDILIFKNLLKMILFLHKKEEEKEFLYTYISLSRSFLYQQSDEAIYDSITKNTYQETKLYQDALELSRKMDFLNPSQFFRLVLEKVEYDSKLLKVHNIASYRIREEYLYQLIKDFEKNSSSIEEFIEFLDQMIEKEYDIKFNVTTDETNSCKIMTIHKSKGLEFPICYYAGLTSRFNLSELRERILFDNEYGLILPKVDHFYKDTFLKTLCKRRVKQEEIGEKIRLLYVAVTRAKEKMIFVLPKQEEEKEVRKLLPVYEREKYSSFQSIIKSIYSLLLPYVVERKGEATKDYLLSIKKKELETTKDRIMTKEIEMKEEGIEEEHYSKEKTHLSTKEEKENMIFGTKIHEYLEYLDFSKEEELNLIKEPMIREKIKNFLESDFMKKRRNCNMRKEYEFLYEKDHSIKHGIIDLLIEEEDQYSIVDYKLKNIEDTLYEKQLNGYREYIEKLTNKKCSCYLYSIMDNKYKEIER